jgi:hypothetical protein
MVTTQRTKLPLGTTNFEELITLGYYYVDKTRYIEMLENEDNRVIFFTRPRKFGKSLFLTTLARYYSVADAGKFQTLFGEYYIGQHPTTLHNSFFVLNLDFSGIDTFNEDEFRKSFAQSVRKNVRRSLIPYKNITPKALELVDTINRNQSGIECMEMFFDLAMAMERQVYVIIDEYDHYANDLIAKGTMDSEELYHRMIGANGIVRDFYESLKEGTKSVVSRVLLSGVTPVMLDDVTSGFNISNNISLKPEYNEILGFTQKEVDRLIDDIGIDRSLINVDMEQFYNGYMFHKEGEHKVYNSNMVLYYTGQIKDRKKPPAYLIDSNLKMDYGRLRLLLHTEEKRKQLTEIIREGECEGEVVNSFALHELNDNSNFASLLFYLGLLTIDNSDPECMRLKIPNYSIRTVYWGYLSDMLTEKTNMYIDTNKLSSVLNRLAYKGLYEPFFDYFGNFIKELLSNRDLQDFDEKYIKILMMNFLWFSPSYLVLSEREVSTGYPDIYLQRRLGATRAKNEWVIEVKYLRKKDDASTLDAKRTEAREQLERYRASQLLKDRPDVRYLTVIFSGKDLVKVEEIPEQNEAVSKANV